MIKKRVETQTREVEIVESVVCNKCAGFLTTASQEEHVKGQDHARYWYGLVEASFSTGYFSDVLPDDATYSFSLCEPCLKDLMDGFKIPAEVSDFA